MNKHLLKRFIQDEMLEWQIFNTDYVNLSKLASKVASIMDEKPSIEPYQLGFSTLSLLTVKDSPCKVFTFEETDYYGFGKALLLARDWASETNEVNNADEKNEKENETEESEIRTISLVGKSEQDFKHFIKEDVLNMWKALGLGKQKGKYTKSNLIREILSSQASSITFTSKFHRTFDLREMELSDLLFVLSHDQLICTAEVVLCEKDYVGKSDEEIAQTIKMNMFPLTFGGVDSYLIGI